MASSSDVILIGITIFMVACGLFVVYFMSSAATTAMLSVTEINSSAKTVEVLEGQEIVRAKMDYIIFGTFLGLLFAFILSGWFVGGNAVFMIMYFFITVIGVVVSMILSNVWETFSQAAVFGATSAAFPITNHLLSYLPYYSAVIGFLGMVVMFAKPALTGGQGGTTY